jgi:hypothetical protein
MSNDEILIRYKIVQNDDENENPSFRNFKCCDTHPLCEAIHSSKKMFTRSEIETISVQLGYSVWDSIGGNESCQCKWKSFIVNKK